MNCKPGDLAVIVHTDVRENVGHFVDVLYPDSFDRCCTCWVVQCSTPLVVVDRVTRKRSSGIRGAIPDAWLRPVAGMPGQVQADDAQQTAIDQGALQ